MPEVKQKQPQERKTVFETLSLPVAKILSPVARQAPTKFRTKEVSKWMGYLVCFFSPHPPCEIDISIVFSRLSTQIRSSAKIHKKKSHIIEHLIYHVTQPIHMYRPRSGKCTQTLQIQKLILGTRPKMTGTENNSGTPPTKLQIQKLMPKQPHQKLQIQKLIRKKNDFCICIF